MDSAHSHQGLQYDECSLELDCVPHAVPMVLVWGEEVEAGRDTVMTVCQDHTEVCFSEVTDAASQKQPVCYRGGIVPSFFGTDPRNNEVEFAHGGSSGAQDCGNSESGTLLPTKAKPTDEVTPFMSRLC